MLRKRLIGVIAVQNGWAVQSFGYRRVLPLGRPERLAENLDRWGADEIMVLDFGRSRQGLGPDLDLVHRLAALGLSTPLTYGGGVARPEDAVAVTQAGVERICIDGLLHDSPESVPLLTRQVGAQALVAAYPLRPLEGGLRWYDHRRGTETALDPGVLALLAEGYVSEALVVDWLHEGVKEGFDASVLEECRRRMPGVPLLLYGGISEPGQLRSLLADPAVAAVCIGNFLNYKEHAVQELRREVFGAPLRAPIYASGES